MKRSVHFEGYECLTKNEKRAFAQLRYVTRETIWQLAIKKVLAGPTVESFRSLIAGLNSQARDNEPVMMRILGTAYGSVRRAEQQSSFITQKDKSKVGGIEVIMEQPRPTTQPVFTGCS